MDSIDFGYSIKNIPLPSRNNYIYKLIEKTELLLKRMRWKAFFFDSPDTNNESFKTIYKSKKCPPQMHDLKMFENDMIKMIENIKFKATSNEFLDLLQKDVRKIRSSNKVLVQADKTQNFYQLDKETYKKILNDNVTKTYQKTQTTTKKQIDYEAKKIATKFKVADKVDQIAEQQAFFSIKDHKPDFRTNPKYRLLNPAKTELGKLSKSILERINQEIKSSLNLNQWRNSFDVIQWFKNIKNKKSCTFTTFDIDEFYPSISEKLLSDAINFASSHSNITPEEKEIIFHCRKSLLFHDENPWVKQGNTNFDVTMGSFDGAEVCELVGLFILEKIKSTLNSPNIGLYRDDGLAVFENHNGHSNDQFRKKLIQTFKDHNLKITILCNLKKVDFLDLSFDLNNNTYKPFNKPNNPTRYINVLSNHPPSIIKQLPKSIEQRINNNSCNKEIFENASHYYNNILKSSGYKENIKYLPNKQKNNKNRSRNIIWYNPPYSKNVETSVGKIFLKLINKHFGKTHRYHKIFNKNNVKISYCSMDNMKKIINSHNKKVLSETTDVNNTILCNCRVKTECPLQGKCLSKNIVYRADVSNLSDQSTKTYLGLCATSFKTRFNNHSSSFNHKNKSSSTELSKHIWELKEKNKQYSISWSIAKQCHGYNPVSKSCNLCLSEKFLICNFKEKPQLLNKKSELVSQCRHQSKFLLKSL